MLVSLVPVARTLLGSWLEPNVLLAMYWSAFSLASLLLLPHDPIDRGIYVALYAVGCSIAGAFVQNQGYRHRVFSSRVGESANRIRTAVWPAILCTLCGLASVVIVLYSASFSLGSIASLDGLLKVSHTFSVQRYASRYQPPFAAQILLGAGYAASCFGGTLAVQARQSVVHRGRLALVSLATFLPAVAIMLVRSERAPFILSTVLYVSFYLARGTAVLSLKVVPRRYILYGMAAVPVLMVVFAVVALLRAGVYEPSLIPELIRKISSGAFGSLASLSIWATRTDALVVEPALGGYTAAGIYDLLGWRTKVLGLFQDFNVLATGYRTNIYTLFRPLIEDYTIGGFGLFWLLFGFASSRAYSSAKAGRVAAAIVLAICYTVILYSFNTSPFMYNSILMAVVLYLAWHVIGENAGEAGEVSG
ncbi:MAG: O-antigen polymerase [Anaerolineae bacterium]